MSPSAKVVKTKRVQEWRPVSCKTCGQLITEGKDGTFLKSMVYLGMHKSTSWGWAHKKCVGSEVKR